MRQFGILMFGAVALGACSDSTDPFFVQEPSNLTYELEASGDPLMPDGVLLRWDGVDANELDVYNVYSRASLSAQFDLRASTTSARGSARTARWRPSTSPPAPGDRP